MNNQNITQTTLNNFRGSWLEANPAAPVELSLYTNNHIHLSLCSFAGLYVCQSVGHSSPPCVQCFFSRKHRGCRGIGCLVHKLCTVAFTLTTHRVLKHYNWSFDSNLQIKDLIKKSCGMTLLLDQYDKFILTDLWLELNMLKL